MSEFENKVDIYRDNALKKLRQWRKEDAAKDIMRDYLNQEGMVVKSGSKLEELLDERHRIALMAVDDNIKLKAIDSALNGAAGNTKDGGGDTNNNQFNIYLNSIKKFDE